MIVFRPRQQFNRFLRRVTGYQLQKLDGVDPQIHVYDHTEKTKAPRYIDIGAGTRIHPLWHGIDNPRTDYGKSNWSDIRLDLTAGEPWPIASGSVDLAYTSHTIEHLNDRFNAEMFRETFRVLRPGGLFRLACPNIDLYAEAYERGDEHFLRHDLGKNQKLHVTAEQIFLDTFAGPLSVFHRENDVPKVGDGEFRELHRKLNRTEFLNALCQRIPDEIVRKYPKEHKTWLSVEKLISMLRAAGFSKAYRSAYGQSCSPMMRNTDYFDFRHPNISLYVEAGK